MKPQSKSKTFPKGTAPADATAWVMDELITIHLASKLLKCRDACRKFWGEGWETKQKEWRRIIQAVMRQEKTDDVLIAAIALGKKLDGIPLMTCLGVIMEMLEKEEGK